ncbi:MAG: hypothetical protein HKN82_08710 [Akkermansiaceae bacterium]|nr:hypothetical protein [Akkermansiaceae bacterium]NNM28740.1 hypothetical protein [Akkermansiaceae bacterium]
MATGAPAPAGFGALLLEDDFEREEPDPAKESVGNGWGTNSKSRAKGRKQVDLDGGAMHITRAAVADHGVSVHHDVAFRDAVIRLRFKLGPEDDLGINIADMGEKSVHAGHICMARIRPTNVEITDLKTGRMKLEIREARQAKKETPEMKKLIAAKAKRFPVDLATGEWHHLEVRIEGDMMRVAIDGKTVGDLRSPGIGHPTKRRLRLAVGRSAWIDEVRVWGRTGGN